MADRAGSKKTGSIEGASHALTTSHADAVVEVIQQATATVRDLGVVASNLGLPDASVGLVTGGKHAPTRTL